MNRDELKELGLDAETVKEVMKMYGKSVSGYQSDIEKAENEVAELKTSVKEKDDELKSLKDKEGKNDELNSKIEELKNEVNDYKKQLSNNAVDKEILKSVSKDAHDADDVFKFIDRDSFEIDEKTGEVTNLKEVLDDLRKDKPYLFAQVKSSDDEGNTNGNEEGEKGTEKGSSQNASYYTNSQRGNKKPETDHKALGKRQAEDVWGKKE